MLVPSLLASMIVLFGVPSTTLRAGTPPDGPVGGLGGGGPLHLHTGECITAEQRAAAEAAVAEFHRRNPATPAPRGAPVYRFFPQAGTVNRDLMMVNYVDLNPGAGILDYECTAISYNGHAGHDSSLRNFTEQAIGVPIFAAADGVVVATDDGHPDMNTQWLGQPANYVIVDHGGGRHGWYWHMRSGSVAVSPGQAVAAGTQLGLTASSGNSTGPHLHFESRQDGATYEPFAGACRPGSSGWEDQIPLERGLTIGDFGFTQVNLDTAPQTYPPFTLPRTGQLAFSEQPHWFWLYAYNLPAASTWRVRYLRPDGTTAFTSNVGNFGAQPYYRSSWWYWWYTIPEMGVLPGTWRLLFELNGQVVLNAPVVVHATRLPGFNRPPAPVTGAFEPAAPEAGDVVFARVSASLVHDDPDYDIVRFRYHWRVGGVTVRDVTSAAHSDALAAGLAVAGETVTCTVTPSDGSVDGTPIVLQAVVGGGGECPADWNQDDIVNSNDISAFLSAWLQSIQDGTLLADFSGDGVVNSNDISAMLSAWLGAVTEGC